MGQIVSSAAKPKRCNKNQLSQLGVLAAGLHVLVSSDNSMNAAGQGNFDCYIEGDGTKAATALPLKTIAESALVINGKNSVNGKAVSNYIDDTLFDTTLSENLVNVNDEDVYDAHSMNVNGVISSASSAVISGYIPIKPNTTYSLWYLYAGTTLRSTKPICATVFNADKQVIPAAGISNFTTNAFTITDTSAAYMRLTCYRAYFINNPPMVVEGEEAPASYVAYSETKLLKKDLFPKLDEYAEADKVVTKDYLLEQVMSSNLLNTNDPDYVVGVLNYTTGEVNSSSTGYHTSGYIPIKTNTYYIVGCDGQLRDNAQVRVLVGYDENKQKIYADGNTSNAQNPFIISDDRVKYIRISLANNYANATPYMNEGNVVQGYEDFEDETKIKDSLINHAAFIEEDKKRYLNYNGNITDGQTIVLGEKYDVKLNKHAVFRGRLGTFGKIIIGHGMETETSYPTRNAIAVDNTNIYFYYWEGGSTPTATIPHGLTFANTISICIDTDELMHVKVTIISDGNSFSCTNTQWYGNCGSIYATSVGTILSLVEFSWTCDGYDKLIQIYGDSYLGTGYDGRWAYYLVQNGFADKCLLDGWGGRTTEQGYASFIHNISLSTPKYAVWLLGGNNPDPDTEEPNERWLHYTRLFLNECDKRGIIPILQLVQEMPTKKMTNKNEWVKNSGRRYVDFVTPVGSDLYEYWYEGMLSSDNVHPTSKGAIEFYTQFISQFPEIMIQD